MSLVVQVKMTTNRTNILKEVASSQEMEGKVKFPTISLSAVTCAIIVL